MSCKEGCQEIEVQQCDDELCDFVVDADCINVDVPDCLSSITEDVATLQEIINALCDDCCGSGSSGGGDHDWYIEETTNIPTDINDNIYTLGNVGINTDSPQTNLEIEGDVFGNYNNKVQLHLNDVTKISSISGLNLDLSKQGAPYSGDIGALVYGDSTYASTFIVSDTSTQMTLETITELASNLLQQIGSKLYNASSVVNVNFGSSVVIQDNNIEIYSKNQSTNATGTLVTNVSNVFMQYTDGSGNGAILSIDTQGLKINGTLGITTGGLVPVTNINIEDGIVIGIS